MIIDNFNHLYYWARQSEMILIMQDKVKFEDMTKISHQELKILIIHKIFILRRKYRHYNYFTYWQNKHMKNSIVVLNSSNILNSITTIMKQRNREKT